MPSAFGFAAACVAFLLVLSIGFNLWRQRSPRDRLSNWFIGQRGVLLTVVPAGVLVAVLTPPWLLQPARTLADGKPAFWFCASLLALVLVLWFCIELRGMPTNVARAGAGSGAPRRTGQTLRDACIFLLAGAGALAAAFAGLALIHLTLWSAAPAVGLYMPQAIMFVGFGPPLMIVLTGVATAVFTGLVGRAYSEGSREWWSRLNAWFLIVGSTWLLLAVLSFMSVPLLAWVEANLGAWSSVLGVGWGGSLLGSLLARKPDGASAKTQIRVDRWLNAAAVVAVLGVLVAASAIAATLVLASQRTVPAVAQALAAHGAWPAASSCVSLAPCTTLHLWQIGTTGQLGGDGWRATAALALLVALVFCFAWRVDINKFSLHNLYKNRLVRCYLGASNPRRLAAPFTGLDDEDDLPMHRLRRQRPLHIVNAAMNLTQGENLAWQERKAASFSLTPAYCGYKLARTQGDTSATADPSEEGKGHYVVTRAYAGGVTLGSAMATSGAAVSPNMGAATHPARAFLLTLFNVRLGRWSPNPARGRVGASGPNIGFLPLVQELFGYSNERRDFLYLSDGGHFENLGLYELVRRRCAVIVAVDAGADPPRRYDDVGEAIRKCRVDLGVHVSFLPNKAPHESHADPCGERGFTLARIDYGSHQAPGWLILLKPTVSACRSEPADVVNYAARNTAFPQQTTADQFFDESQFESYRRLGFHIADICLQGHGHLLPRSEPAV
jgi:hypothetical protein